MIGSIRCCRDKACLVSPLLRNQDYNFKMIVADGFIIENQGLNCAIKPGKDERLPAGRQGLCRNNRPIGAMQLVS